MWIRNTKLFMEFLKILRAKYSFESKNKKVKKTHTFPFIVYFLAVWLEIIIKKLYLLSKLMVNDVYSILH